jgi:hypothetical protein
MNGFERHGIKHSSASALNLWANAPDVWCAQYLHGRRSLMSSAAWRGIAIEAGTVECLRGESLEQATANALKLYDAKTALSGDPKRESERAVIAPCIAKAVEALKLFGEPDLPEDGKQEKVEITCVGDGWRLPVIGYLDLPYHKHGRIIDLKTTLRMPGEMSREHQRQRAIYQHAHGNYQVDFLYVTPTKVAFKADGEPREILGEIKTLLNRQERFLRLGDKDLLTSIVPVIDSFYWSGFQATRSELYGL